MAEQITIYKNTYRPHLYGAANSKRVFLGSVSGRKTIDSSDGIEARSLSRAFKQLMTLYSNSSTGFGPHAVRKIVTSILDKKRDISDFDNAATLAMHSKKTSRDSYASHQVEAAYNHYVHRLQLAGVLRMPSEQQRKIEVDEIEYNNMQLKIREMEQRLIELTETKDAS